MCIQGPSATILCPHEVDYTCFFVAKDDADRSLFFSSMLDIVIASTNPIKINIMEVCFLQMYPDAEATFRGVAAPSGVADQPMTDEETLQGVLNRLEHARRVTPEADYWIALEGGLIQRPYGMSVFGYVAIRQKGQEDTAVARSSEMPIPFPVARAVAKGQELGKADDDFYGVTNSNKTTGASGLLTEGLVTRLDLFQQPVIYALCRLKHPDWFRD